MVQAKLSIGESEDCDLCFPGVGLSSKHVVFSMQKSVLMVQNLADKGALKIGWHKCEQGKSYILDHKDKLTLGKVQIQILEIEDTDEILEAQNEETQEIEDQQSDENEKELEEDLDENEEEIAQERPEETSIDINSLLKSGANQHLPTKSNIKSTPSTQKTQSRFSLTKTFSKLFKKQPKLIKGS